MKLDKLNLVLILAGLAAGIYLFEKFKSGVNAIAAPAETGLANLYVWFTNGPPVQASGQVVFQDGTTVPISSIASGITFNQALGAGVFTYNGTQYGILQGSGDGNGNYPAVPLASIMSTVNQGSTAASTSQPWGITSSGWGG